MEKIDFMRLANSFAKFAVEGYQEPCERLICDYAQAYRKRALDVYTALSVSLMDPAGFDYQEYRAIREMLVNVRRSHFVQSFDPRNYDL